MRYDNCGLNRNCEWIYCLYSNRAVEDLWNVHFKLVPRLFRQQIKHNISYTYGKNLRFYENFIITSFLLDIKFLVILFLVERNSISLSNIYIRHYTFHTKTMSKWYNNVSIYRMTNLHQYTVVYSLSVWNNNIRVISEVIFTSHVYYNVL